MAAVPLSKAMQPATGSMCVCVCVLVEKVETYKTNAFFWGGLCCVAAWVSHWWKEGRKIWGEILLLNEFRQHDITG